jgi:hypothetical protein
MKIYKPQSELHDFVDTALDEYLARYCFRWGSMAICSADLAAMSETKLATFAADNGLDIAELERHLDRWCARGCPRPDEIDMNAPRVTRRFGDPGAQL